MDRPSTLSLRLFAGLVAGLLACSDPAAQLAARLETGHAALADARYREAVIEYKNALRIDPNQAAAHWGLAQAYLGSGQQADAYWEVRETLRLDPDNEDARLTLVRLLPFGTAEDAEEALTLAQEMIAANPDAWSAWLLRALGFELLDRQTEAGEAFAKATELAGEETLPIFMQARFLQRRGERAHAEPLLVELARIDPGRASYATLGEFLAEDRSRDADAEAAYRRALELAPDSERVWALRALAGFLFARDRHVEAEALALAEVEARGNELDPRYLLANLYAARGERQLAEDTLRAAATANPDSPRPLLLIAELRAHFGEFGPALELVEEALALDPGLADARLHRAGLLLELGALEGDMERSAQGRSTVDALLASEPGEPRALLLRAKIVLAEGEPAAAEALLRRVLDARPRWPEAHFLLGQALIAQGRGREAQAALTHAVELAPDLRLALQSLVRLHADLRQSELVVEIGRRALIAAPGDLRLRLLVAEAQARLGRPDDAIDELEAIPPEQRSPEVWHGLGRAELLRGDEAKGRAHLERALGLDPYRPELLGALLELSAQQGDTSQVASWIANALEARPQDARIARLAGEAAISQGDFENAELAFRKAIDLDPNELVTYQRLAATLALEGRQNEVLATYEKAARANPEQGALQMILASLYEGQGRTEDAMDRYEAALRLDPGLALARNNLAWLLVEGDGDLDRALDLAQEAKAALPDDPNVSDTLGWILYRKEIPAAAVGYLLEAEQGFPDGHPALGGVRLRLALAHEANGEPTRAREAAERGLASLDNGEQPDPAWAADLRALRERVGEPAPTEG